MLVKDCMTRHPIMIVATTPATEAQKIMVDSGVRHLPVVGDGKRLQGLVTRQTLSLPPDTLGSLNVWEITRYVANLTVQRVMIKRKDVVTIGEDKTVERAARELMDHRIGCLPVLDGDGAVVGILTEVDVMEALQVMLGLPAEGIRVTVRMPDRPGEFAKLSAAIGESELGVMGIGTFPSPRREGFYDAVIKIRAVSREVVMAALGGIPGQEVVDVREVV